MPVRCVGSRSRTGRRSVSINRRLRHRIQSPNRLENRSPSPPYRSDVRGRVDSHAVGAVDVVVD
jgi:hypothetical protein